MRLNDIPFVPAVLGLVLGPLAEHQFRRAVAISEGDLTVFLTRPISAALLAIALAMFGAQYAVRRLAAVRERALTGLYPVIWWRYDFQRRDRGDRSTGCIRTSPCVLCIQRRRCTHSADTHH